MLINPGVLAHKIKRNKIQLQLAPLSSSWVLTRQGGDFGEGSTLGSFHRVASLPYEPCEDQVTGSARTAASCRHRDPRPSLLDEGSSYFLPWLPPSRLPQQGLHTAICSVWWHQSAIGHGDVPGRVPTLKKPMTQLQRKGLHGEQPEIKP